MENGVLLDENSLLERISQGDKAAFKNLHDHYWNDIFVIAVSFLKSQHEAMDTSQDIFLKLWMKKETLTGIENFRSYLFIVARNELITAIRKKIRAELLDQKYASQKTGIVMPDDQLMIKELELAVAEGASKLPSKQKLMFELTRNDGLTHDEIASKLGIAKKTVSNITTKALMGLRRYLLERGDLST